MNRSGSISILAVAALGSILLASSIFGVTLYVHDMKVDPGVMSWLNGVNWEEKHHIEFYGTLLNNLATAFPKLAKTYSIGTSWRERPLWCIEISSVDSKKTKVEVAVIANVHGGEHESGEGAAYTAWWLVMNYGTNATAKEVLDNYIVYVIPVINPDGYEFSFLQSTRSNFRPIDHDGDGYLVSDPPYDTNGDGIISTIYTGPQNTSNPPTGLTLLGSEGDDFNNDGILANDPRASGIDMNRNWGYMWGRYDPDVTPQMGYVISSAAAGPDANSEPEVQALQKFLSSKHVVTLSSLHTGEQSCLYPWCYTHDRAADKDFMNTTTIAMAEAFTAATGHPFYSMQSYDDYPSSGTIIDWCYGKLGIFAYTVEVYDSGLPTEEWPWTWGNVIPPYTWEYIGDWGDWNDVWFRTRAPSASWVPVGEQLTCCKGTLAGMLAMFYSVVPAGLKQ